jgi:hypothetical protein
MDCPRLKNRNTQNKLKAKFTLRIKKRPADFNSRALFAALETLSFDLVEVLFFRKVISKLV